LIIGKAMEGYVRRIRQPLGDSLDEAPCLRPHLVSRI
jgi:hypothetical protein